MAGMLRFKNEAEAERILGAGKIPKIDSPVTEVPQNKEMSSRPTSNPSNTDRIKTGCGWLYITVCPGDYKEVFFKLGKTGGCPASYLQALAMTFSMAWRAGVPLESMVNNLQSIGCPNPMWNDGVQVLSCADGIAHILKSYCGEEPK